MDASDYEIRDHLARLREIAVDVLQQRGLTSSSAPALEKNSVAASGGEYLILLKLVDWSAKSPVKIMLIRGTGNPLECLVNDRSDSNLVQTRILAMLDALLEKEHR
jgi:hypothetical protein